LYDQFAHEATESLPTRGFRFLKKRLPFLKEVQTDRAKAIPKLIGARENHE